jgi:hypothetical protein
MGVELLWSGKAMTADAGLTKRLNLSEKILPG